MTTFKPGKTYTTRPVRDFAHILSITVARRTATTLTTVEGKRLGIFVHDGEEQVMPLGRYAKAPVIGAGRVAP